MNSYSPFFENIQTQDFKQVFDFVFNPMQNEPSPKPITMMKYLSLKTSQIMRVAWIFLFDMTMKNLRLSKRQSKSFEILVRENTLK